MSRGPLVCLVQSRNSFRFKISRPKTTCSLRRRGAASGGRRQQRQQHGDRDFDFRRRCDDFNHRQDDQGLHRCLPLNFARLVPIFASDFLRHIARNRPSCSAQRPRFVFTRKQFVPLRSTNSTAKHITASIKSASNDHHCVIP